jgi:hypothetical protein
LKISADVALCPYTWGPIMATRTRKMSTQRATSEVRLEAYADQPFRQAGREWYGSSPSVSAGASRVGVVGRMVSPSWKRALASGTRGSRRTRLEPFYS